MYHRGRVPSQISDELIERLRRAYAATQTHRGSLRLFDVTPTAVTAMSPFLPVGGAPRYSPSGLGDSSGSPAALEEADLYYLPRSVPDWAPTPTPRAPVLPTVITEEPSLPSLTDHPFDRLMAASTPPLPIPLLRWERGHSRSPSDSRRTEHFEARRPFPLQGEQAPVDGGICCTLKANHGAGQSIDRQMIVARACTELGHDLDAQVLDEVIAYVTNALDWGQYDEVNDAQLSDHIKTAVWLYGSPKAAPRA
jgi:hypothetical protein